MARLTIVPALALAVLAGLALSCAGARRVAPEGIPGGAQMGVYRATVEAADGRSSRFRLLLYASRPDRFHGEIVSPLGTTEVIVDGGGGSIAVTLPRKRVGYAGAAGPDVLHKLIGVRLGLAELVGGLLDGTSLPQGPAVRRLPVGRSGLPELLEVRGDEGALTLRLRRLRPLRISTAELGTGRPPPGIEILPLEELTAVELPNERGRSEP